MANAGGLYNTISVIRNWYYPT